MPADITGWKARLVRAGSGSAAGRAGAGALREPPLSVSTHTHTLRDSFSRSDITEDRERREKRTTRICRRLKCHDFSSFSASLKRRSDHFSPESQQRGDVLSIAYPFFTACSTLTAVEPAVCLWSSLGFFSQSPLINRYGDGS
ncbi:hypothetical protein AOLI_G00076110 [Acnodon oligacanthus]